MNLDKPYYDPFPDEPGTGTNVVGDFEFDIELFQGRLILKWKYVGERTCPYPFEHRSFYSESYYRNWRRKTIPRAERKKYCTDFNLVSLIPSFLQKEFEATIRKDRLEWMRARLQRQHNRSSTDS